MQAILASINRDQRTPQTISRIDIDCLDTRCGPNIPQQKLNGLLKELYTYLGMLNRTIAISFPSMET